MLSDSRIKVYSPAAPAADKNASHCHVRGAGFAASASANYKLSPYAFLYQNKDFVCLYNSINIKKVYGDGKLKNIFTLGKTGKVINAAQIHKIFGRDKAAKDAFKLLLDAEIIVPENYDKSLPLKRLRGCALFSKPHINMLYFLVTNACNLQCRYCSIESDRKKPKDFKFKHMDYKTAKKGVDLFIKIMDKSILEPSFMFYGGEPLLNWDVIKKTIQYIRQKETEDAFAGRKVNLLMVTNGALIDKEKVKFFKKYNLAPSVSIDGLQYHHDAMRIMRDTRKGSWKDTMRGYKMLKEAFGSVGVSCTMGLHNYKDLEEIAEYFATEFETRGLGINLYKSLPPDCDIELDAGQATRMLIKAYEIFRRFGIYEDRIMRKIKSFVTEKPWFIDCGAYGGQIALNVDGKLGPCHIMADNNEEIAGHIDDKDIIDKIFNGELMRKWCRRSPVNMEQCFDCEAIAICGGGCVDEVFTQGGSFLDLDKQFCEHVKITLEWMIKDLGEKIYSL